MKKITVFLLFISLSLSALGQRNADYGIFGGVASYIGDINTNRLFYSPGPAGGIFYRYNFNPRQAIRANIFAGGIQAADRDFNNAFQQARDTSFSGSVIDFGLQFEFNFLPYSTQMKKWNFTPYIAGGAGLSFINNNSPTYVPVIPFSLGFKINIHKNLGLEAEYGFRKTFYDNFDGLEDNVDPDHKAWLHNNDWYSFAGVSLTWKIFNKMLGCPAYSDLNQSRRR